VEFVDSRELVDQFGVRDAAERIEAVGEDPCQRTVSVMCVLG
jgi:hypothetical protein